MTVMRTPVTTVGLCRYDRLPPERAVVLAWTQPGTRRRWHRQARTLVRRRSPRLAAGLRTMASGQGTSIDRTVEVWTGMHGPVRMVVADAMPLLARALDRLADDRYDAG